MKTEIERARESIKEYRKGYGQSQLSTDCIIQLMIGHAKSEQLRIDSVKQRLIDFVEKNNIMHGRQLEDWKNEMNTYEYISELPLDLHQLTEFINSINVA